MPLSKLFQRRSSLKDKKVSPNSSEAGPCANGASTSVKCHQTAEESKDHLSTEHLPPSEETRTITDSEVKVEQQASSTINETVVVQNVMTSSLNEQSPIAESIIEVAIQCESVNIAVENATAVESMASCIEAPLDVIDKEMDEVDASIMRPIAADTIKTNDARNITSDDNSPLNSTSNRTLLPTDEDILKGLSDPKSEIFSGDAATTAELPNPVANGMKSVFRDSKDEVDFKSSAEDKNTNVESCDFNKEVDNVNSLTSDEQSLNTEKNSKSFTPEVCQDNIKQLPENAQKEEDEPVPNSEETGSTIGTSNYSEKNNGSSSANCDGDSYSNEKLKNVEKSLKKKTRSFSFKETGSKPKNRRRKCESESAADANSTDDEGFDDSVMELHKKDIKEVIEKCVDKLLRESIAVAVRKVDVEGLCDEVIKTMADRSQSEASSSNDGTVEQKLNSSSAKDYADLDTFEDSVEAIEEENKDKASGNEAASVEIDVAKTSPSEICEEESLVEDLKVEEPVSEFVMENELADQNKNIENAFESSKDKDSEGYRTDFEESTSIHSLTKDTINGDGNEVLNSNESFNEEDISALRPDSSHAEIEEASSSAPNEEDSTKEISETNTAEESNPSMGDSAIGAEKNSEISKRSVGLLRVESDDLLSMYDESELMSASDQTEELPSDLDLNVPEQNQQPSEEEKKKNWKVGYLQVKMPPKSRGKGHIKAWKKRCVAIHPDEFANDPKDPWLMISVYSGHGRHTASFWKSVSCRKTVVYRSGSSSQRYAFTIAEDNKPLLHLAAESEAQAQEWMAAVRTVLWPPSPVVQLEKMLNGSQFEVSLIDNDFSYRAGLLGMYGHLTITPTKLILVHPQQGYVIQEWYLNTVDKFELMHQTKIEDVYKVLSMTTCSDSSTGQGEILIFCREAVSLLQSLASTIHQILTHHSKQEGGKYTKELEEMAGWLAPAATAGCEAQEEYYKVPPRQVRSLLDIPNFIFNKPLTSVASTTSATAMDSTKTPSLIEVLKTTRGSQDSGISSGTTSATDDFLNCSTTSFVVGTGKSSDSELSDSYTPPLSPAAKIRNKERLLKKDTVN
ncbi:hypothetical protein JTE90_002810 [Oedothorax gibbosus]|uniref:PH domain-containing protein n=1 Tax=Oedothorax gibbosus TaxID=931172 RepID=A0AAV6U283_9ARAC|nr:hypothetical protein JTE90_002810 [Oedothorax gibbosus]